MQPSIHRKLVNLIIFSSELPASDVGYIYKDIAFAEEYCYVSTSPLRVIQGHICSFIYLLINFAHIFFVSDYSFINRRAKTTRGEIGMDDRYMDGRYMYSYLTRYRLFGITLDDGGCCLGAVEKSVYYQQGKITTWTFVLSIPLSLDSIRRNHWRIEGPWWMTICFWLV